MNIIHQVSIKSAKIFLKQMIMIKNTRINPTSLRIIIKMINPGKNTTKKMMIITTVNEIIERTKNTETKIITEENMAIIMKTNIIMISFNMLKSRFM